MDIDKIIYEAMMRDSDLKRLIYEAVYIKTPEQAKRLKEQLKVKTEEIESKVAQAIGPQLLESNIRRLIAFYEKHFSKFPTRRDDNAYLL